MTVFDFTKDDRCAWFDMEGGGKVQIRNLTPADWIEIRKTTRIKLDPVVKLLDNGKYQLFEREDHDGDLEMELINDRVIVGWENLLDANGQPIPCTRENKVRLMRMVDSRFRDFVNEKLSILTGIRAEQKEASEKN